MKVDDDEINTKGLDAFLSALTGNIPVTRVGIMGANGSRNDADSIITNAELGRIHEFGLNKAGVQRSFLRMPLMTKFDKELEEAGLFDKEAVEKMLAEKSLTEIMKILGIVAERTIQQAFDTGGFGTWKQSDMSKKKVKMTLVETQALRRSITSEVEEQ